MILSIQHKFNARSLICCSQRWSPKYNARGTSGLLCETGVAKDTISTPKTETLHEIF